MFISTDKGEINLQRVICATEIKELQPGGKPAISRTRLWYDDHDGVASALTYTELDLEQLSAPVIPAAPGYFVVGVIEEAPYDTFTIPIVAWRIGRSYAEPICIDVLPEEYGVVDPSGRVTEALCQTFPSLEEYRRERIAQIELIAQIKSDKKTGTAGE